MLHFRCTRWVQACGREELLNVIPICNFYEKFRVCSMHFENCMYNNPFEKSRLLPNAVPIKYEALQIQGGYQLIYFLFSTVSFILLKAYSI